MTKLLPSLTIKILGFVESEHAVVTLLESLAEPMRPHWRDFEDTENDHFVKMRCEMPVPPDMVPCFRDRGDCQFLVEVSLRKLEREEMLILDVVSGFCLEVKSTLTFSDGTSQDTGFRYERVYPCTPELA